VVILLDAVDDALARCEVDDALAADGVGDGATLGRVFAFGFNGDGVVAKDVEVSFGVGLLEELATLGGGRDGIEHAGVGNARLGVVGDELIAVCSNSDAWITRRNRHITLSVSSVLVSICSTCATAGNRRKARASNSSSGLSGCVYFIASTVRVRT